MKIILNKFNGGISEDRIYGIDGSGYFMKNIDISEYGVLKLAGGISDVYTFLTSIINIQEMPATINNNIISDEYFLVFLENKQIYKVGTTISNPTLITPNVSFQAPIYDSILYSPSSDVSLRLYCISGNKLYYVDNFSGTNWSFNEIATPTIYTDVYHPMVTWKGSILILNKNNVLQVINTAASSNPIITIPNGEYGRFITINGSYLKIYTQSLTSKKGTTVSFYQVKGNLNEEGPQGAVEVIKFDSMNFQAVYTFNGIDYLISDDHYPTIYYMNGYDLIPLKKFNDVGKLGIMIGNGYKHISSKDNELLIAIQSFENKSNTSGIWVFGRRDTSSPFALHNKYSLTSIDNTIQAHFNNVIHTHNGIFLGRSNILSKVIPSVYATSGYWISRTIGQNNYQKKRIKRVRISFDKLNTGEKIELSWIKELSDINTKTLFGTIDYNNVSDRDIYTKEFIIGETLIDFNFLQIRVDLYGNGITSPKVREIEIEYDIIKDF